MGALRLSCILCIRGGVVCGLTAKVTSLLTRDRVSDRPERPGQCTRDLALDAVLARLTVAYAPPERLWVAPQSMMRPSRPKPAA
jgi:hypothetical protein